MLVGTSCSICSFDAVIFPTILLSRYFLDIASVIFICIALHMWAVGVSFHFFFLFVSARDTCLTLCLRMGKHITVIINFCTRCCGCLIISSPPSFRSGQPGCSIIPPHGLGV